MEYGLKAFNDVDLGQVKEATQWRIRAAVAWSLLVALGSYPAYSVAVTFNPLDLRQWLYDFTIASLTASALGSFVWLGFLLISLNACLVQLRTVRPAVVHSRWHAVAVLLISPKRLAIIVALSLLCGLLAVALLVGPGTATCIQRYVGWSVECGSSQQWWCVNELRCFVLLYGMAVGCAYAVWLLMCQKNCMVFPILQQPKFFRFKAQLHERIWSSAYLAWWVVRFIYVTVLLMGIVFRGWLTPILLRDNSSPSPSFAGPFSSIWGLLNPSLVWHLLVTSTAMVIYMEVARTLLHVYLTERYPFPIDSVLEGERDLTLAQSLTAKQYPYIEYLAFLDLSYLSKYDHARRQQLFMLSQPGGHPHRWRRICQAAITGIAAVSSRLQQHMTPPPPSSAGAAAGDKSDVKAGAMVRDSTGAPAAQANQDSFFLRPAVLKDKAIQAFSLIKSCRWISYFVTELSDSACGNLFSDSQQLIWAIDGLSNLAIASYTEDDYGAVQGSLKDIIATLLDLQELIEKFVKASPALLRKPPPEQFNALSVALLLKLRMSTRVAIHRLAEVFGQHASFLSLTDEHQAKLRIFAEYRE